MAGTSAGAKKGWATRKRGKSRVRRTKKYSFYQRTGYIDKTFKRRT